MKRETRNLIHEKGGRIREVEYLPIKSDGQDGDARIYNEDLYIKTKGNWVKIMSGDKIINQEITRNIDVIVSEGVLQHTSLSGVTANQHHQQVHTIDGSDHTGTLTVAKGGTGVTSKTGTGSVVLSDSPTFTGTVGGGALSLSGNITMTDDTSIGIADDAERIEFDGAGDISFLGCNVGIGTNSPLNVLSVTNNNVSSIGLELRTDDSTLNNQDFSTARIYAEHTTSSYNGAILKLQTATDSNTWKDGLTVKDGNVGIGHNAPDAPLHVFQSTQLGDTTNDVHLLSNFESEDSNNVKHREWARRDASGSDWFTWRLHDAISVDASYATPGTNTRVWWERDPYDNIQQWGHGANTYLTINAGNVGIGTTAPNFDLEVSSATGGQISLHRQDADVDAGDVIGQLIFSGSGGESTATDSLTGAVITAKVATGDDWDADNENKPTQLEFYTQDGSDDSTLGTPRMTIDKSGNVGIGEPLPDTTLEVLSGTTNQLKLSFADGTDTTFGTDTNGYLTITPSGSKILIADNDSIGSSSYASGFAGNGWIVSDGTTVDATFDNLAIRGTLSVYELLIQQIRATNGNVLITSSAKVESVSGLSTSDDDGTITFEPAIANTCPFVAGDIILSQQVNPGALVAVGSASSGVTGLIKKMVYRVASVSNNIATVTNISGGSETAFDNTAIPVAGDEFVRIGNYDDSTYASRQSVMYLTSDDTNAPFIDMKGDLNSYADWTNENSTKLRLGRLDGLTAGGTNEYGLWAGPSTTNYIKAGSGGVFLKGSEATYLKATANTLEFFDTNKKMEVTGGNITMYADNGSTVMSQWDNVTLCLGGSTSATDDCIVMSNNSGVKVYDNSTDFVHVSSTGVAVHTGDASNASAVFGATTYIGLQASEHIKLTGSSMEMKDGSDVMMSLAAGNISMDGQIIITSIGTNNVVIGDSNCNDIGTSNVIIGIGAGAALLSGGTNNIFIGTGAGAAVTTGDKNILLGTDCGNTLTTGGNNVLIGYDNDMANADDLEGVALGNDNEVGDFGIALGFDNDVTAGGGYAFAIGQDLTVSTGSIWIGNGGTGYSKNQWATGATWSHSSDRRIKKNITREGIGLDFINDLYPSQFEYKPQNEYPESFSCYKEGKDTPVAEGTFYGLIAQEVKESIDKYNADYCKVWDDDDPDGIEFLGEGHLIIPLIKAVQELSAKVTALEAQI